MRLLDVARTARATISAAFSLDQSPGMTKMDSPAISIHDAYQRWAENYPPEPHNPLMRLEQEIMTAQLPPVARKDVLDLACGSGRYASLLQAAGAATVVALDFSSAMLRQVAISSRVQADVMQLPFRSGSFDVVVSGLAIGHAPDIHACVAGIARVLRPGGTLLYSDFHPLAAKAGLTRSCKVGGHTCTLPGAGHALDEHLSALQTAGLHVDALVEPRVGNELQERFRDSDEFYRRWHGLPLALVVRAHR